jgi:hypothetical protein
MANRYWVGGTATWDATAGTKWASTSGGAGGQTVPTTADSVFFDANSGANTITIGNGTCNTGSLTLTGFTGTLAFGTNSINVASSGGTIFLGVATLNVTGTPVINFTYSGSVGTRTISSSQLTEANAISFNISAGSDIVNFSNAKNVDFTGFSGSVGNSTRAIYGNLICSIGMTWTAGTLATTLAATSGTQQITTNGKTLDFPITQNGVGGTVQLQDNLTMGSTRTYTLTNGALNLTGNSGNWTLSTGAFSSSNANIRSIAFGTGNITLTNNATTIWTNSNVTNFSYTGTPTINCTYAGAVGTRLISNNGTAAQVLNFNITAGTDEFRLLAGGGANYGSIDYTGFSGTATSTAAAGNINIFRNLTISSTCTFSITGPFTFVATSGVQQVTTNGKTLDCPLIQNGVGGTTQFQDALTQGSTRNFTITNGTVQLKNGVTSTVGNFVATNSNVKFLQSTTPGSQATLSQASGTVNVVDLTIRDINAVGGASWNAYTDFENTDAGNNDGWNFSLSPPYSTAELPVTLRPFTQPRRF